MRFVFVGFLAIACGLILGAIAPWEVMTPEPLPTKPIKNVIWDQVVSRQFGAQLEKSGLTGATQVVSGKTCKWLGIQTYTGTVPVPSADLPAASCARYPSGVVSYTIERGEAPGTYEVKILGNPQVVRDNISPDDVLVMARMTLAASSPAAH